MKSQAKHSLRLGPAALLVVLVAPARSTAQLPPSSSAFHRQPVQVAAPAGPGLCVGTPPAGCCSTGTVSFSGLLGPIQPPSSGQVTVPKFNPALGQLLKVEYFVRIEIPNTPQFPNLARFENTNSSATCSLFSYSFQTNFLVSEPTGVTSPQPIFPGGQSFTCSNAPNFLFAAFDGTLDGQGPSGLTETCAPVAPVTSTTRCRDSAADLAFFTSTGPGQLVAFPFNTLTGGTFDATCNNFFAQISTFCQLQATVLYTYCNNRPPVANDDVFTLCQGPGATCLNVLANDTDPENLLNCSSITLVIPPPPSAGIVQVNPACTPGASCPACCVNFTPAPGFSGTTSFVYRVADQNALCSDTGVVTVNVCRTVANNDTGQICAGTTATFDVLANDFATCGALDCTTMQLVAPVPAGFTLVNCGTASCANCRIQYAAPLSPGPVTVTVAYRISNSQVPSCQATGVLTVTVCSTTTVNDTGTICAGTTGLFNVLTNDSTTCGTLDCTTMQLVAPVPPGFSLVNCGTANCTNCRIQYAAPASPGSGTVTVAYRISNNQAPACQATGVLTINVCSTTAANDTGTICAGTTGLFNVLANDTTTCGTLDCTTMQLVAPVPAGFSQVNCGTASCANCRIQYVAPATPGSGTVTVAYRISNSQAPACQATGVLTVTVCGTTAVNDTGTICAGATETFDVLANDTTTCGTLNCTTMQLVPPVQPGFSLVGCGTANCATCRIQYTAPAVPGTGPVTVAYRISNNAFTACQATGVLTINYLPVAQCAPSCTSDSILAGGGSLLLYPEFDNRFGVATMLTVTNANTDAFGGGVQVEFIYIGLTGSSGADYCQEFNRTATLTPADTLTVLTAFHNPFQQRGYVYLFARNGFGQPIAFDYLIGNQVSLDGVETFQWSVNPFSFGSPLPTGALTDVNPNFRRDLDGVEYVQAPDQILVPRFLGQSSASTFGFSSELILIPLTGGVQFTTMLDFLIYNDNEQAFSAQTQVRCWAKRPLASISPAFREDFLQSLVSDDPDEIYGEPDHTAGWFRVDGNVATSTATNIADPVILAVLVEQSSGFLDPGQGGPLWHAADLPFAEGQQSNGRLLSFSLFGN